MRYLRVFLIGLEDVEGGDSSSASSGINYNGYN
jgi:hypothetical protein